MVICHITSMHDYNDDRIFERACKGLVSSGNEVSLIAEYPGTICIEGIEIIGLRKRSGLKRRILSSFEAYRKACKLKADVYHFHDPDLIPWMFVLAVSGNIVAYDVHENYESRLHRNLIPKFLRNILSSSYRIVENFFSRRFSGITVVSESMLKLFHPYKKPAAIIGNVVYKDRLKDVNLGSEKESRITIYTSGTNSPSRNCVNTIKALPSILKEYPDVVVKFAGSYYPDGYKEKLMEEARYLRVIDNVVFEGMMPWEENFKRTSRAHIGCVFYEDNLNNRVTLPNRLFEYMFCGVAVLGEDFPEVRKILDETEAGI